MTIYLVRHAKAGDRGPGPATTSSARCRGAARSRPRRSSSSSRTARSIGCSRARTSGAWRRSCRSPACAASRSSRSTRSPRARASKTRSTLVRKHSHHDAVMCSHGDVIPMLLEHYAARGVDLGTDPVCPKGCTWILEIDGADDVVAATYLAPSDRVRPAPFGGAPARPAAPGCRPSRSFPDSDGNDTTCRSTDARMASE